MVEVQLQEDGVLSYIPAGKAGEMGLNPIDLKCEWKQVQERLAADSLVMGETLGYSQVGKAWDFDSHIRWFKSSYPNEKKTNIYKK